MSQPLIEKFPDPLIFRHAGTVNGSMLLQLTHRYRYLSNYGQVKVPQAFITDGASIPRLFWSLLSPLGDYFGPAVIHDFLYSKENYEFDRAETDIIFYEAMRDAGVAWWRCNTIYYAVRLCGGSVFHASK